MHDGIFCSIGENQFIPSDERPRGASNQRSQASLHTLSNTNTAYVHPSTDNRQVTPHISIYVHIQKYREGKIEKKSKTSGASGKRKKEPFMFTHLHMYPYLSVRLEAYTYICIKMSHTRIYHGCA